MNGGTPAATSIRRRLLIFLLPPLSLLMIAGAYMDYRATATFVRASNDRRLAATARMLASSFRSDQQTLTERAAPYDYLITQTNGTFISGDPRLPVVARGSGELSYTDSRLDGQDLRIVTLRTRTHEGVKAVTVAESDEPRTGPDHLILASTWFINFILLDITLLIVWIGVHFGLKPVVAVRRQIESRSARELRLLETASVPTEVRPLVDAINLLFEMLNGAARNQRQFVADTAHQLRTPIAGLLGSLEVLMREPVAEPIRGRLASLHEGVQRLSHSANQLLALARADPSTSQAVGFETTDLKAIVDRVVERNVDRAVECGLDLGVESMPASAVGNDRLLDDLLSNLLDNALKYTPRGGCVTVRCGYESGSAYLEVEDDGPGIPQSERSHVLARFYRIPGALPGGCGLGLAIVDEIARLHGAGLSIETGSTGRGVGMKVAFAPAV